MRKQVAKSGYREDTTKDDEIEVLYSTLSFL